MYWNNNDVYNKIKTWYLTIIQIKYIYSLCEEKTRFAKKCKKKDKKVKRNIISLGGGKDLVL